jgi:hypothetical protein
MTLNELIEYLTVNGAAIGQDASAGNKDAKDIMKFYWMLHRCPSDPGALAFTCEAIKRWEKTSPAAERGE